jgi:hypothetical protein
MGMARLVSWGVCVVALLVIAVAAQNTPTTQSIIAIRNVTGAPRSSHRRRLGPEVTRSPV